jgi:ABC-type nitrate/sulfonate/bicarbonate transport system permease component
VVSATGAVGDQSLASAASTARAVAANAGALASASAGTLEAWAVGIAVAIIAGVALGTLAGHSRLAEASTEVLVRMMRPLPSLALIPIAILVAGLGLKMTSGLVAFTAFWPVFINTRYGIHQVDSLVIDTARTLGFSGVGLVLRFIVPAAALLIASGIQVAISLALVVTVSVELVGGTGGIGSFVLQAQQSGAVPALYAGIFVGGFIGWALNAGYSTVVRRVLPWRDRAQVTT